MTRKTFLVCVAALFSQQGALSFTVNESSTSRSSLGYANSEVLETSKLSTFRNSIVKNYQKLEDPAFSASTLLTNQLAREFSTARRYLLAAGAVKGLTQHFYAAEEQQRFRAMELIEFARINGISLDDYSSQVNKMPIDKTLAPQELMKELLLQEQQDIKFLDKALAQASSSMNNPDLVSFLVTMRSAHIDRQEEVMQLVTQIVPSLDVSLSMNVIESATAQTSEITHQLNLNLFPKSEGINVVGNNQQVQTSIHHVTAAGATGAIGVAAVDSDSLPSTDDILDALPSTEDILDILPINAEDIVQVVDTTASTLATFVEEQSEFVDTLQQNLLDTETLSQLVNIVAQLY